MWCEIPCKGPQQLFRCSQACLVCHLVTGMSCPFPTPTKGTKHTHEAGTKLNCLQTHSPTPSPACILIFFFTYSHYCPSHTHYSPTQAQIFCLSWSLDCWSILLLAQWVINPWPQQRSGQNEQGNNKGRDSWFHLNFPKEQAQLTAKEQPGSSKPRGKRMTPQQVNPQRHWASGCFLLSSSKDRNKIRKNSTLCCSRSTPLKHYSANPYFTSPAAHFLLPYTKPSD